MATSPEWSPTRPARVVTEGPQDSARPSGTGVLVLNHHRDEMAETLVSLEQLGYAITETQSIIETHRVLAKSRPALILLNPLVLQPGSLELELLEELQRNGDPVPVIMLLDSLEAARAASRSRIPILDFITKPFSIEELRHRIALMLASRDRYLALHQRTRELEGQVLVDFKTGLINDRHFKAILSTEFKRSQRHRHSLSLLLVDVDEFKQVNDSTEYSFGDEVLCHVARCMKRTIRTTDYAARFGGDEFALLLPHTTPDEAVQTANRVRRAISGMLVDDGRYTTQVTVSIGIDTFDGLQRLAAEDLRRRANKALHRAKLHGKDQVWLYDENEAAGEA